MDMFWFVIIGIVILLAISQATEKKADPEAFARKQERQKELGQKAMKTGLEIGGQMLKTFLKK